jgi:hypothetical protein
MQFINKSLLVIVPASRFNAPLLLRIRPCNYR